MSVCWLRLCALQKQPKCNFGVWTHESQKPLTGWLTGFIHGKGHFWDNILGQVRACQQAIYSNWLTRGSTQWSGCWPPLMCPLVNILHSNDTTFEITTNLSYLTRSCATANWPREALYQSNLAGCSTTAGTSCTTNPEHIEVMEIEG